MIEKVFKVGDTITIKRTSQAGTGYRYALVRLTGGVALVEELSEDADTPGGTSVQSFIFRFLQQGQVEIQFAYYRDLEDEQCETHYYGADGQHRFLDEEENTFFIFLQYCVISSIERSMETACQSRFLFSIRIVGFQ